MEQIQRVGVSASRSMNPPKPRPLHAIGILAALVPIIAVFIILGRSLHIEGLYMGFLFATYWGSAKHLAMQEFAPALVGALAGIGQAYLFYALPIALGSQGGLLALAVLLVALYCSIRGDLSLIFNTSFLIFLTVSTIPALTVQHDFIGMAVGTVSGAVYMLMIFLAISRLFKLFRSGPKPAAEKA